jgi:hypothetical protein
MKLYDYIKSQYDQGKSDEEIESILTKYGYTHQIAKSHIETFRTLKNGENPNKKSIPIIFIAIVFSIAILLLLIFFNPFSEKITPVSEEGLSDVGQSNLNIKNGDKLPETTKTEKEYPACTSNAWFCSSFGECSASGQQTRTCILEDSNCINPDAVKPITTQSCTPPIQESIPTVEEKIQESEQQVCTSSAWLCDDFEDCSVSGQQTRTCTLVDTDCINPNSVEPVTIQSCIPSLQTTQGSVDLIVDAQFYSPLQAELKRFKEDIERDTGFEVKLIEDNWLTPSQVKNIILDDFNTNNLIGAILIGDIPFTYTTIEKTDSNPVPSDYYYQRLASKEYIRETEDTVITTQNPISPGARDIWTGRLLPPGQDLNERINLLRRYFQRNHDYRIGKLTYDRMLYSENTERVYESGDFSLQLTEYANTIAPYTKLYSDPSKVEIAYALEHEERKNSLLDKIGKKYEIVFLETHGSDEAQWLGEDVWIRSEDLANNPPNSLFIDIYACNNGDLTNSEYFAGHYLFSGNSLLVRANSITVFIIGVGESLFHMGQYIPLASGVDFGTFYKNTHGGTFSFLFGDPTLTLRNKNLDDSPRLDEGIKTINLGTINVNEIGFLDILGSVEVENIGNVPLRLVEHAHNWEWLDSDTRDHNLQILLDRQMDGTITKNQIKDVPIPAGETGKFIVRMALKDPGDRGRFRLQNTFYTNDPLNPYLTVNVEANFVE